MIDQVLSLTAVLADGTIIKVRSLDYPPHANRRLYRYPSSQLSYTLILSDRLQGEKVLGWLRYHQTAYWYSQRLHLNNAVFNAFRCGFYAGSEGTLAIITEATLKLHGVPKVSHALRISFPNGELPHHNMLNNIVHIR